MANRKLKRELRLFWKALNSKNHSRQRAPWYVPKIPSILSMLIRCFGLFLFNIAYFAITLVLIQGEDVLWKFKLVDLWYSNAGTNPQDVWTFVAIAGFGLIWGVGMFWVVGMFDRWFS